MRTTRRDLFRLGALATAAAVFQGWATSPAARAARPLRILILGGTGFTGPFQVQYALARGHQVTLFNRGKRPSPEWPGQVEQLEQAGAVAPEHLQVEVMGGNGRARAQVQGHAHSSLPAGAGVRRLPDCCS